MSTSEQTTRIARILLVEDNPGDVELIREALESCEISSQLQVVRDGLAATDYLSRSGPFADATPPHIILLDLNLPRKDGRQFLSEVKRHPTWRLIPIIVWTTSTDEADVAQAYTNGANSYFSKPSDLDSYMQTLNQIVRYWFAAATLTS